MNWLMTFRNTRSNHAFSTEAGAEGLNLQFCNLVVNFDLPWNPQRVEQRIGRCHRYGQQRDVLVLNFLNRSRTPPMRGCTSCSRRSSICLTAFSVPQTRFLGRLKTASILKSGCLRFYQSCRLPSEINAAFDALRKDLETRMTRR